MNIDKNIRQALIQYKTQARSYNQIAKDIGVSTSTVTRWINTASTIQPDHWKKLFPQIRPYLPGECIHLATDGSAYYELCETEYEMAPEIRQMLDLLAMLPPDVQADKAREMIQHCLLKQN